MKRLFLLPLLLLLAVSACSRKSDEELYRDGLGAEARKDAPLALRHYAEAVENFPSTAYAESSQYRIAMLHMNADGEKRQAVEAQKKFCAMFPSSANAPSMLFLAAFTYNNDLGQLDTAKLLYEEFLAKYPNDKLAESARFELATLGKSPDELLRSGGAGDTTEVSSR